jgi:hypothetical protein
MNKKIITISLLIILNYGFTPAYSASSTNYSALDLLPDFSGLWEPILDATFGAGTPPSLTAEFAQLAQNYSQDEREGVIQDTPAANCVPPGMPIMMRDPYPLEFLMTPGKITILIEAYSQWRQIFTDGRSLPDDPDPSFSGYSIGSWEGDTLVVESTGFTTATAMGRSYGIRHSNEMRIVERMRIDENDALHIETTIHDPVALTEPWVTTLKYGHHPEWTLTEYICQENNRNFTTSDGKAGINLQHEPAQ